MVFREGATGFKFSIRRLSSIEAEIGVQKESAVPEQVPR